METRILADRFRHLIGQLFAAPVSARRGGDSRLCLLDGARGLAALAVLMWHYQHFFYPVGAHAPVAGFEALEPGRHLFSYLYGYGLYAVPIFWMISGFVFASVYYGAEMTARAFFVNRLSRLYPLHLITLCVVALLQAIAWRQLGVNLIFGNNDLYHFGLQLLFASNWGFERGYSFNAPIWSVSVEVLIYALFWLTRRWLPRWGIALPLALSGALLALKLTTPGNLILQCGYFFFLGVTVCRLHEALRDDRAMLAALVFAMITAGFVTLAVGNESMRQLIGLPGLFGGAILALVAVEAAAPRSLRAVATLVGDNTYGMYLWHVPVQLLAFILLAPYFDMIALAASPWFLLGFVVSVAMIARIGFVLIERPARTALRRFGSGPHTGISAP
ncbi:acyltransferase family protein [Sphingomonas immobilis]|uniref:Acyltransferase n=1 Tax=Sphingomonas immobilis TaxID=3063997 RepID=A0ABT8ZZG7_9SPHN|nr:acyltransferase [Sphingomonas sp. CA1-15]MDO7842390.1 acyltransferase [Sphingomonas sp. CA1-15]